MPVIVIGADTEIGLAIIPALQPASGEIRLFVTSAEVGNQYRSEHKVAVGDVSDGSHVGGAAIGAFCAVVIVEAAHDDRERHFAATPHRVLAQWADGLSDAGVSRVIVVGEQISVDDPLRKIGAEYIAVETSGKTIAEVVTAVTLAEAAGS